jgi:phosphocarrier protein HPr
MGVRGVGVRGAGGAGYTRRCCSVERQDVNVAEETVEIKNHLGLHLRAASTVAQAAAKFKSVVTVIRGKDQASARSVTALIMLGAGKGTRLRLRAEGDDSQAAVAELSGLFNDGFGEE